MKNPYAVALGKMGAGKPRKLSIERRRELKAWAAHIRQIKMQKHQAKT